MVLFVLLVTTILLYDLVFNISCFFPENGFYFCILWHLFYIVMSQWLLFQKHFQTLQGFLTDFISLHVSTKLQLKYGMLMEWGKFLSLKLIQIWVCLLLCLCFFQQFKTRHFHLILLSNLLYSTLTLVCESNRVN